MPHRKYHVVAHQQRPGKTKRRGGGRKGEKKTVNRQERKEPEGNDGAQTEIPKRSKVRERT